MHLFAVLRSEPPEVKVLWDKDNLSWLLIGRLLSDLPTKQETIEGQNNGLAADQ